MFCHKQKWSEVGQSLNGFGFVVTFCCNVCLPLSAKLDPFCTACLLIWDNFARPVCSAGSVFCTLSAHLGQFCTSSAHLRPTSTSRWQLDDDCCWAGNHGNAHPMTLQLCSIFDKHKAANNTFCITTNTTTTRIHRYTCKQVKRFFAKCNHQRFSLLGEGASALWGHRLPVTALALLARRLDKPWQILQGSYDNSINISHRADLESCILVDKYSHHRFSQA